MRKLKKVDPSSYPGVKDKEDALAKTEILQKKLYDLLYKMFAHNQYSLLIILHGIDTSGKDGTVQHIFEGANPQGLKVVSFKKPSEEESRHDFLWRCHKHTPEKGSAVIFNRSYYEEVTTVRIHPEFLESQNIPAEIRKKKDFFKKRFESINNFENMLNQEGTVVLKFLLHISKDEQKERLEKRLRETEKNWKFSPSDLEERKHWDQYMNVFADMIQNTNTRQAPWFIVPADHKWYRNYVISKALVESLEKLKMSFPKVRAKVKKVK